MKGILPVLFFFIAFWAQAQIKNVTLTAGANTSFINSATQDHDIQNVPIDPASGYTHQILNVGRLKESYTNKIGMEAGVGFQVWESGKFFVRTGLNIQYVRYHRKIEVEETQAGNIQPGIFNNTIIQTGYPIGSLYLTPWTPNDPRNSPFTPLPRFPTTVLESSPNLGRTTTLYAELPVSVGRTFFSDKLSVAIGMQAQLLAYASVVKEEFRNGNMVAYKDKSGDGFSNALFGVNTSTSYRILQPLAISIRYSRTLSPIYDDGTRVGGKTYFNTFSLGLAYQF